MSSQAVAAANAPALGDKAGGLALPIPPHIFLVVAVVVLAGAYLGLLPAGLTGALPLMLVLGATLFAVGEATPIVKDYFGGGPIVAIFGAAALATSWKAAPNASGGAVLPAASLDGIAAFMKQDGFLDFYISSLITGSVLGMERSFLMRAVCRYIPAVLGGVAVAMLCAGVAGLVTGYGFQRAVVYVAVPIMGGGMGAGAVPLAEMFGKELNIDAKDMLSVMVPAVALGNALSIAFAGCFSRLTHGHAALNGEGRLMRSQDDEPIESPAVSAPPTHDSLSNGLLVAAAFFVGGNLLGLVFDVHPYALMILSIAAVKLADIVPRPLEVASAHWFQFVVRAFTPALLVGIGIAYTDLRAVAESVTPVYLLLVAMTIFGAAVGAGAVSYLVGFFPLEGAVTAGLCMANMGGTGDVAVLSAAGRMQLMPFAQISSRLGGAAILVVASMLVRFIH